MRIDTRLYTGDLQEIQLSLYSNDFHFRTQMIPPADENGMIHFHNDAKAHIKFHDTYEVDRFIEMLQRFKQESEKRLGWWNLE